ncbi:substrate-binding periplasmic protein [Planctobacterium marinum]|uniref:Solute-binding protein family 3/N-terminal domain-containing protein n=1 Tax=Planctobacterium marinum TaxID=1631968 RepID=A0AA48HSZ1_9ALTE|nr:hypothetical protein MACH26_07840 [Planctobacterium marinum]
MLRRGALYGILCSVLLMAGKTAADEILFVAEQLPPIHFINSQKQADGFLVKLAQAAADRAGLPSRVELMPQARAFEQSTSQSNVFMLSLLRSDTREKQFQWVGSVYETKAFLIGLAERSDIQLSSLEDAKSLVVGTVRGYFSEYWLRQRGFSDKHNLGLAVQYDHLWGMLFKGHVDLVLTNALSQNLEINKAGYKPEQVKRYLALPELTRELYIATGLNTNKKIVEQLSSGLESMKVDGTYQALKAEWLD